MKLLQLVVVGLTVCIIAADEWVHPASCKTDNSCIYEAKWIVKEEVVEFTIIAKQNITTWTGIAFSKEKPMDKAELIYGYINSTGHGVVFDGWIPTRVSAPVVDAVQNLINASVSYVDGYLKLEFSHHRISYGNVEFNFTDTDCYHFIFPVNGGNVLNDVGGIDIHFQTPNTTDDLICFLETTEGSTVSLPSINKESTTNLHMSTPPGSDERRGKLVYPLLCEKTSTCLYKIEWELDTKKDVIKYEIEAKQAERTWTGVAFADDLQLKNGADVVYGFISKKDMGSSPIVIDGWTDGPDSPIVTDLSQDVLDPKNVEYDSVAGLLKMSFSRKRHLSDAKDLNFTDVECHYFVLPIGGGELSDDENNDKKLAHRIILSDEKICIRDRVSTTESSVHDITMTTEEPLNVSTTESSVHDITMTTEEPLNVSTTGSSVHDITMTTEEPLSDEKDLERLQEWRYPMNCEPLKTCEYRMWYSIDRVKDEATFNVEAKQNDDTWTGIGIATDELAIYGADLYYGLLKKNGEPEVLNGFVKNLVAQPEMDDNQDILLTKGITCSDDYLRMHFSRKRKATRNRDADLTDKDCVHFVFPIGGGKRNDDDSIEKPYRPMRITKTKICFDEDEVTKSTIHGITMSSERSHVDVTKSTVHDLTMSSERPRRVDVDVTKSTVHDLTMSSESDVDVTESTVYDLTTSSEKPRGIVDVDVTKSTVHDLTMSSETPLRVNVDVTKSTVHDLTMSSETPRRVDVDATKSTVHDLTMSNERPRGIVDVDVTKSTVHDLTMSSERPRRVDVDVTKSTIHDLTMSSERPRRVDVDVTKSTVHDLTMSSERPRGIVDVDVTKSTVHDLTMSSERTRGIVDVDVTKSTVHDLTISSQKPHRGDVDVTKSTVHDLTMSSERPRRVDVDVTKSTVHDLTMSSERPLDITKSTVHDLTMSSERRTREDFTKTTNSQLTTSGIVEKDYKRVCYYSSQAQYREGKAKCLPADLDPSLCTHFVLAYANLTTDHKLTPSNLSDVDSNGLYEQFNDLKLNSNVKTMLAVGGRDLGTNEVTEMLSTKETRLVFINSTIKLLRLHKFDGISIDLEYPESQDKAKYTLLLQEMREAFVGEEIATGEAQLLLTATVAGKRDIIDSRYEAEKIHEYLDFMNLMTYNLHNESDRVTEHPAALYPNPKSPNDEKNIAWVANYWATKGVPKKKLIIGIAAHGSAFTLADSSKNDIGAPVVGPSPPGEFSKEAGILYYFEICPLFTDSSATKVLLAAEKVPYIFKDTTWIGCDDIQSLEVKVNWLKDMDYGGWEVSMVDSDDFKGEFCNQGIYPVLNTLYKTLISRLKGTAPPLSKILKSTEGLVHSKETMTPTGHMSTLPVNICEDRGDDSGLLTYPGNCRMYISCSDGRANFENCPSDKPYFDPDLHNCNSKENLSEERKKECNLD